MSKQASIEQSTGEIYGVNVFNGKRNYVRFHTGEDNSGLVFRVKNEEFPASLDKSFEYKPAWAFYLAGCISVRGRDQRADHVEHLLADVGSAGIDNLVIELSDGVCPRFDYDNSEVFEILTSIRKEGSSDRVYLKVNGDLSNKERNVKDEERRDGLHVEPAKYFFIDYTAGFPHNAVGEQHHRFNVSEINYREEVMQARPIFFMPPIPEGILRRFIQPWFGITDSNALLIGGKEETRYRNKVHPEGLYGSDEFVRHKVQDVLGTLALLGKPFKESGFFFYKTGHEFDLHALRTLRDRGCFVDA